uniref:Uncharacterized protein n=1 Tax=Panagrolaimus sp. PS1159 TaxID=55785 RepID=A0AC35G863_9BILA
MRWKSNRRGKRLLQQRRRRQKNKAAFEERIKQRARIMQRNEFIFLTKYREIIRRELSERQKLKNECSDLQFKTIKNECQNRCNMLQKNNNTNIKNLLEYLEKIEINLKSLHSRWASNFDYNIEEAIKNFQDYLLKRFQTYVSELDLSDFNLKEEEIDSRCKIDDELVNIERKASIINFIEMDELKRKLKMLKDELEEEEIRELACVKIRERETIKLNSEIELLSHQIEMIAVKEGLNLTDLLK